MKITHKILLINATVMSGFLLGVAGVAAETCVTRSGTVNCVAPMHCGDLGGTAGMGCTSSFNWNRNAGTPAITPGATACPGQPGFSRIGNGTCFLDPAMASTMAPNCGPSGCDCSMPTVIPTPTTPPTNTPTATTCTFAGQVIAGGTCGYVKTNPAADACNADIMHDGSHWDGTGAMIGVPGVTPDSQLVPMEPGDHCIHGCPEGQSKMDGVHCMTYQAYCAMPTSNCPSMSPGADLVHPASPTNGLGGNVFQAFWNFLTHRR